MDSPVEVVTLGHAIVDVLAPVEDSTIAGFGLEKGTMNLVDDERSARLYATLGPATAVSGGSAANTAAGLASLGASVAFVGRVRDDDLGQVFGDDIRAAGVDYHVPPALDGPGTGTSVIMVTPDAERTMCTSLGAGDLLEPGDVDAGLVSSARLVYLEGYLVGLPTTDPTVKATLDAADRGQTEVALSLSDPQWVTLHGKELDALVDRIDLLFGNEQEVVGLTGEADLVAAAAGLARRGPTVIVTRGPLGAVVVTRRGPAGQEEREDVTVTTVPAEQVGRVVDTTGAGDLFAAGYLFGHVRGLGPDQSARLGAIAAAEIISHFGARPTAPLGPLAAGRGLLSPT
jgi:sugar/nucleoside kinase (ribokinase family)